MEMIAPVKSCPLEEQQAYRTYNGDHSIHSQARPHQRPATTNARPHQSLAATRGAHSGLLLASSAGHQGSDAGVSPLEGGGGGTKSVVMGGPKVVLGQPDRHVGVLGDMENEKCQGGESEEGYR